MTDDAGAVELRILDAQNFAKANRMRKALAPFARLGDFIATETSGFSDDDELSLILESGHLMDKVKVRDFREAYAAMISFSDDTAQ